MIGILLRSLLVSVTFFAVGACAETPNKEKEAGINMMVLDVPCNKVITSITEKLEEKEYPFAWVDESQELISVGPILLENDQGSEFTRTKKTYSISVMCRDEVTTRITCTVDAFVAKNEGDWIKIHDIAVLNDFILEFLELLEI